MLHFCDVVQIIADFLLKDNTAMQVGLHEPVHIMSMGPNI